MRVPLYIKVMLSYLLVVALIAVPTYVYLSTHVPQELQGFVEQDLERQARTLAQVLAPVSAAELAPAAATLVRSVPQRLTVVDPSGRVLGDTLQLRSTAPVLDNHLQRPEIREALASGRGVSIRSSATSGEETLYVAVRFPAKGPVLGAVRLALPMRTLQHASKDFLEFFRAAGALALSGAVLLSLLAAVVVSRPLRKMGEAARAFAAGDFGHAVEVGSADEIGDVARALADLAAELRSRLVQAGSDRMTLRAVIDNLPVGVVIFDVQGQLQSVNSCARRLLEMASVQDEGQRAHQLTEHPDHAAAITRVLNSGVSETLPLQMPWLALPLQATWLAVAAASGASTVAVILTDPQALQGGHPSHAVGRWTGRTPVLQVVTARSLCDDVLADLRELLAHSGSQVRLDLGDDEACVVEVGGKVRRALTLWLQQALAHCAGSPLQIRGQWSATRLRLTVWTQGDLWQPRGVEELLNGAGGSAGASHQGVTTQAWIDLARA